MLCSTSIEWPLHRQGLHTLTFHVQDEICQIPCQIGMWAGRLSAPPMRKWNMRQSAQKVMFHFLRTHIRQRRRERYTHSQIASASDCVLHPHTDENKLIHRYSVQIESPRTLLCVAPAHSP